MSKKVKRRCKHVKASGKLCNKVLPPRRYFHCEVCVKPESDYGDPRGAFPGFRAAHG